MAAVRQSVLATAVFGVMSATVVATGAPASAADSLDIGGVGPANVAVDYSCDRSAGVAAVSVMVGDPDADSPSATGSQNAVTCDGTQQSTVVLLTGTPLSRGQRVQVRAALVKADDTVVTGQAKLVTLG
jgi:hypothetical protein